MKSFNHKIKNNQTISLIKTWHFYFTLGYLAKDSCFEDIQRLLINEDITINLQENELQIDIKRYDILDLLPKTDLPYEKEIRNSAIKIASVLKAYTKHCNITFNISGGIDSRVLLSACVSFCDMSKLNLLTSPNNEKDLPVVQFLSHKYHFKFNQNMPEGTTFAMNGNEEEGKKIKYDSLTSWFLNNVGTYDLLYGHKAIRDKSNSFAMGGIGGGEIYKKHFIWNNLEAWMEQVRTSAHVKADLLKVAKNEVSNIGINPEYKYNTGWYFFMHRSIIHSNRFTASTLLGLRPLFQLNLMQYCQSEKDPEFAAQTGIHIIPDLTILLNTSMAGDDYDEPRKNNSQEYIKERQKIIGKQIKPEELYDFEIYGKMTDVTNGPANIFIKIAEDRGFKGNITKENIINFATKGFEKIKDDPILAPHYQRLFDIMMKKDDKQMISSLNTIFGKLATFLLLD